MLLLEIVGAMVVLSLLVLTLRLITHWRQYSHAENVKVELDAAIHQITSTYGEQEAIPRHLVISLLHALRDNNTVELHPGDHDDKSKA